MLDLLDEYARDPMGGSQPLPAYTRSNLIGALARRPGTHVLLAWSQEQPAGLAITFEGFSTFACRPLLNLHDFMVSARFRGQGVGRKLLSALDDLARELGCCKITLEVLQGNEPARALYSQAGYEGYTLDETTGQAQFWQKKLA
ncbi:acetyltransferase family protein [Bordetella holmesii 70147]|uniref:Acetyltransferase family protein n=1 Tax=Bordetella holmesii 1058 TaxID=1247648 RepID=A0ABN0RWP4_9BORD|nr:acetyltransferase family protein [Bordetella holmesii 70147]EXX93699.1 acetyltransferase family protein [Bordetella holmesii 1058]